MKEGELEERPMVQLNFPEQEMLGRGLKEGRNWTGQRNRKAKGLRPAKAQGAPEKGGDTAVV